jgi:hypothetical protein
MFQYDEQLLEAIAALGVRPTPATPPERVRAQLNDLYRYELRTLRDRLVRRDIPKQGYSDRVIALRRRYWMLSVPLELWARRL